MTREEFALLPQQEAAGILCTTVRSLERWRIQGRGPPFVRVGRRALYRATDLERWLASRTLHSTSEADAAK